MWCVCSAEAAIMKMGGSWIGAICLTKSRGGIQRIISHFLTIVAFVVQESCRVRSRIADESDVEHGVSRISGEAFHGDGIERVGERAGDLIPSALDAMAGIAFVGDGQLEQRGVHGFDDLTQRDEVSGAAEKVATGFAATALDEAGASEIIKDLDEKISRYGFALREVLEACKGSPVMELCELGHRPAGVFQFLRDLHE